MKRVYITPSGKKYETLKEEDIVFLSIKEEKQFFKLFNSSKILLQNGSFIKIFILKKKKEARAIVHAHSPHATAVSVHGKPIPAFHYMVAFSRWRRY